MTGGRQGGSLVPLLVALYPVPPVSRTVLDRGGTSGALGMRPLRPACLLLLLLLPTAGGPAPTAPSTPAVPSGSGSNVSLYTLANGSTAPRFAAGSAAAQMTLADGSEAHSGLPTVAAGAVGQGVLIPAGARVSVGCPCNVPAVGSLSLWVRWAAAVRNASATGSGVKLTLLRFGDSQLTLTASETGEVTVEYSTGGFAGVYGSDVFRWDTCQAQTTASSLAWHRLFIAWGGSGQKELRIDDGAPAACADSPFVPALAAPVTTPSDRLYIGSMRGAYGSSGSNRVELELDQLVIWGRVLGAAEILSTFRQPEALAAELESGLPPARAAGSEQEVRLGFGFASGGPAATIVDAGGTFTAVVPVSNPRPTAAAVKLLPVVHSFWGPDLSGSITVSSNASHGGAIISLRIPGGATTYVEFAVRTTSGQTRWGPYRLDVGLQTDSDVVKAPAQTVFSFAVWPPAPPPGTVCRSQWFGSHIPAGGCHYSRCEPGSFLDQSSRLGQCAPLRGHDFLKATKFDQVEPSPGNFSFLGDPDVKLLRQHGLSFLGSLAQTPRWAANTTGQVAACKGSWDLCQAPKLPAFGEYVERTIRHYASQGMRHVELWNEP